MARRVHIWSLVRTVADVKDANKHGAIHFAAREGTTEVCKYLLEKQKLEVDSKDEDGETPLLHVARQGHTETAKYLFKRGADPSISSELGATALHHAAGIGVHVDSDSDAGTLLIWAAGHAQPEAVKVLLDHHANVGANVNIVAGGTTPLHIAADNGSPKIIDSLLEVGGDPNTANEDGLKPIQVAAGRGNRFAAEILLPVTSTILSIPKWSVDGIIEHMQAESRKLEQEVNKPKETRVSQEAKQKAAETKSRGDDRFKRKDYEAAMDAYTQDKRSCPRDLTEAKACRALRPDWPKACYREGAALRLLQRFDEEAICFFEGVQLNPENMELVNAFRDAVEAGRKFHGTDQKKS